MQLETRMSAVAFAAGGKPLARRARWLGWLLRHACFQRVRLLGPQPLARPARLVIASHRNGALDGYIGLACFPRTQFLTSVQLLRHPLLRWMFDGLPVIRAKDKARYGAWRDSFDDPVDAACAQLRAVGDLLVFPEGSSEWGHRPLPYHRGASRIARRMLEEGVPVQVVPLGLHYPTPDRFRSSVDVLLGSPILLPTRMPDEDDRHWESRIHINLMSALDAVSVNCPDAISFETARAHAAARETAGEPYALAFLDAQQRLQAGQTVPVPATPPRPPLWPWDVAAVAVFMLLAAPVLLAGWLVGRRADARNTVSLFRCIGALVIAPLWLAALLLALWLWPLPLLLALPLAALGWWRWPRVMHRSQA